MYTEAAVCRYLRDEIFPQLAPPPYGEIQVTRLSSRKPVYIFFERTRNIMVVGKSFECEFITLEDAWQGAEKELLNLKLLRERFRMSEDNDQVVAPLGNNRQLSAMLITEKAQGQTLDYYLGRAIFERQHEELLEKLSNLARFLAKLHQGSQTNRTIPRDLPQWYLQRILNTLSEGLLGSYERAIIEQQAGRWWEEDSIFVTDSEVIVHGDATPTNFLFYDNNVMGVDLEDMKWADRCWDLGFIAAELKHHFMWRMNDGWAAEPFIGHFLREYAAHCSDTDMFHIVTCKIPLYMAMGLLRIARNAWLDEWYRRNLIAEAQQCLKYGL